MRFNSKKFIWQISILSLAVVVLAVVAFWQGQPPGRLEVYFFNVGHGDAIFIRTPSDKRVLIDGGLNSQVVQKIGRLLPFYDKRIDLVILSHPHPDHITGLISVVKRYEVGKVFYTDVKTQEELFKLFKDILNKKKITKVKIDKIFSQDLGGEAILYFLYPDHDLSQEIIQDKEINNTSIVVKLIYKGSSYLFMGDASEAEEEKLIASKQDFNTDILKIGHHGSSTSSGQNFINLVSPKTAVITCGENYQFSHPSLRVLRRLERAGSKIYRTDESGDIKISTTGDGKYEIDF